VIDPTLVYSTYFGGSVGDGAHAIAVDAQGSVYITGDTGSGDFPTAQAAQPLPGGQRDAFVAKLDPSGSLVYSTYLGGSGWEAGAGVAVDRLGNAYVTGRTSSPDFPTLNPVQANHAGGMYDAYVAKLDPSGSLVYSTYLGGGADDVGLGIAVDRHFSAYVTGSTFSSDYPTQNALQSTHGGGYDAFVTKLDPSGSVLVFSTFLGGSSDDFGHAIGVDAKGRSCVAGGTASDDFPIANALQKHLGGSADAFVAMLSSSGSSLSYSTFLGGKEWDAAYGVAVEPRGSAHVTGETSSDDFPTANPLQPQRAGLGRRLRRETQPERLGAGLLDVPWRR
jgi:Beta-propeller repeat